MSKRFLFPRQMTKLIFFTILCDAVLVVAPKLINTGPSGAAEHVKSAYVCLKKEIAFKNTTHLSTLILKYDFLFCYLCLCDFMRILFWCNFTLLTIAFYYHLVFY